MTWLTHADGWYGLNLTSILNYLNVLNENVKDSKGAAGFNKNSTKKKLTDKLEIGCVWPFGFKITNCEFVFCFSELVFNTFKFCKF